MKTIRNERVMKMTGWQFALECVLVFAVISLPVFAVNCLGQLAFGGTVNPAMGMALAAFFAGPVALLHFAVGLSSRRAMAEQTGREQA